MPMLADPSKKYKRFPPLQLNDRQWPSKTIDKPPRWLSTDLRDGNQSLVDPMDGEQKWKYFKMLVELGYKEIEVSFPSASQTDFDFTRRLVETPGATPDDVWLQVLSPCREELIKRTVDSLKGAKKALLHIYLATSECFQRIVFNMSEEEGLALAVKCTKYARSITKDDPENAGTEWGFEFSPETFSDSRPEYVIKVCDAVKEAWGPTEENPIIFNLPATVEMSTPNVYADQIEYFCRNISEREKVCVSLHPHNDRGCAVAAAELAQMAGADRVEGCLFGNGERTGNVDLVTLALNLYTQGIHPKIDFSDLKRVIDVVEVSNKIPVHPRAPYGGSLVVCAFSGSHQDAIKKGFQTRTKANATDEDRWEVPYLPLDPQDIGRTYEAIIRVNSQSGKGGAAWIILRNLQLDLPRGLQVAFSKIVQKQADAAGRELLSNEIQDLFEQTYFLKQNPRFHLVDYTISTDRSASPAPPAPGKTQDTKDLKRRFEGVVLIEGHEHKLSGIGNGPISSLANALTSLGIDLEVADYKEHAIGGGKNVKAASYIECTAAGSKHKVWGVGVHEDVVQSSLIALLSAASNFVASRPSTPLLFKGKHGPTLSRDLDLDGSPSPRSPKENGSLNVPKPNSAPKSGPDAVSVLEAKANGL
ncbi:2-isopropylmalate synthase protein [Rutstroemia sp. NJR-2017a BVV2]|nr:2-isopropylmalate synthase protein [Rutstroemia sp. NJR-2017a BVV2]